MVVGEFLEKPSPILNQTIQVDLYKKKQDIFLYLKLLSFIVVDEMDYNDSQNAYFHLQSEPVAKGVKYWGLPNKGAIKLSQNITILGLIHKSGTLLGSKIF